jgi:release factor glutamine methyltransferase
VAQARLDARLLLMAATGLGLEAVIRDPDAELSKAHAVHYAAMIARRIAHEPVSRILGWREFWSMEFEITPDTLDPRADSETLIGAALGLIHDRNHPLRILDIGTGSGCLLLALLSELPRAQGTGFDISQSALDVAFRNAERLGFAERANFISCDVRSAGWAAQLTGPFDIIIANPPYIENAAIAELSPEVTLFDPHMALAGGEDGLDFYRMITISVAQLLRPDGLMIFEVGAGQGNAAEMLMRQAGLSVLGRSYDLGGIARVVTGRFKG